MNKDEWQYHEEKRKKRGGGGGFRCMEKDFQQNSSSIQNYTKHIRNHHGQEGSYFTGLICIDLPFIHFIEF